MIIYYYHKITYILRKFLIGQSTNSFPRSHIVNRKYTHTKILITWTLHTRDLLMLVYFTPTMDTGNKDSYEKKSRQYITKLFSSAIIPWTYIKYIHWHTMWMLTDCPVKKTKLLIISVATNSIFGMDRVRLDEYSAKLYEKCHLNRKKEEQSTFHKCLHHLLTSVMF